MIKQLGVNFLCGLIMVPVVLITVGPVTTWVAMALSSAIGWVFHTVPLLGGAIMGAGWQVFVIFGLPGESCLCSPPNLQTTASRSWQPQCLAQ